MKLIPSAYPDARYQRFSVHFTHNVLSVVPRGKMKLVAAMLRAIHAQEDRQATIAKSRDVFARPRDMKLRKAAKKVEDSIVEILEYMHFPREHWPKIRINNVIERLNREFKRRTRVVGTFPDGESALKLVCARLRCMKSSLWGSKMYMSMKHL